MSGLKAAGTSARVVSGGAVRRVAVLGGAGDMGRVIVRELAASNRVPELVIADRDLEKAQLIATDAGIRSAHALEVDLFDPKRLRDVIRGCTLVVNAAGPYFRTGPPVLEACLDEHAGYLDLGDDFEAADLLLASNRTARAAGITALQCAGLTPGLWNVVVRSLADRLNRVDRIIVAWVTGSTPKRPGVERGGRAVIEHMLHEATGITMAFQNRRRRPIPAFRRVETIRFPAPLGPTRVYDLGHAELATFPSSFPELREVRTLGGLVPPVLNGVFQGIGAAVVAGRLGWDEAVDALLALDDGRSAAPRALRAVLRGVAMQCLRREVSVGGAFGLLRTGGSSSTEPAGGLFARVEGWRDGQPCALEVVESAGGATAGGAMDDLTGGSAALFVEAYLNGEVKGPGVVTPEQAVMPEIFLARACKLLSGIDLKVHEVATGSAWGCSVS
ncbi:MAG TPA: saccharopine dehydrogenase NADP-binding domain-containing protein [Candidatus Binataceae bacterium]|nr:saccharopine dehydrogenase NADP-binding domain-containing protein [Candidatus Binataceae bacterium]